LDGKKLILKVIKKPLLVGLSKFQVAQCKTSSNLLIRPIDDQSQKVTVSSSYIYKAWVGNTDTDTDTAVFSNTDTNTDTGFKKYRKNTEYRYRPSSTTYGICTKM